ncbi:glycosyltransferase family 4 protein [Patescibacteria group bacterium]|nr:glycosyltransferase family 4 protein [Patescibacteria group bacterium]
MYDILVFSLFYKPHIGGVERYVENFYQNTKGEKTLILTSMFKTNLPRQESDNVDILRIDSIEIIKGKYFIPSITGIKQIKDVFSKQITSQAEVHTHTRFYFTNVIATYFAKKYKLKHYHFEHGSSFVKDGPFYVRIFAYIFDKTFAKYALKNSQLIFPVSESVRDFLNKNYKNIKLGPTIYNSYDFTNKEFKYKSKPKILKLIFVGRIIKSKGIYELINACKLLSENNVKYILTIIGDGSERENIEEYIRKHNLRNNVEIKGELSYEQVQKEYTKNDIFISPSYSEGFGRTCLEALANNLIVIATDAGGTREIIPKNKLIKLNELSPEIIAEHIISSWNNWEEEQKEFAKIFQNAKEKFNIQDNIDSYYSSTSNT